MVEDLENNKQAENWYNLLKKYGGGITPEEYNSLAEGDKISLFEELTKKGDTFLLTIAEFTKVYKRDLKELIIYDLGWDYFHLVFIPITIILLIASLVLNFYSINLLVFMSILFGNCSNFICLFAIFITIFKVIDLGRIIYYFIEKFYNNEAK